MALTPETKECPRQRPRPVTGGCRGTKFAPTIDENLAKIEHLLGEAARRRADAVLLPECATTGYAYDFSRPEPAEIATPWQPWAGWRLGFG